MTDKQKQKLADDSKHIPTAEVEQDIIDTEVEIKTMEREIEGFRLIGDKMSNFRADARVKWCCGRRRFIEKLQAILTIRKANL